MQNEVNKPHKEKQIIKALQWFGVVAVSLLLVVYFLVFDTSGGQKTPVIGKVNGVPMYYARDSIYGRTYQRLVNTYKQFGISTDGDMGRFITELAFKEAAVTMILEEVADKNINVSDNFLIEVLKNEFVDTNGVFAQEQYQAFLTRTPTSEKLRIQNDIKDTIVQSMFSLELFGSVKQSSIDMKNSYLKSATKRDIEMVYIDVEKVIDDMEIEDSELSKYFNDNKTNFAQAEVFAIAVSSEMSADNIYNELSKSLKTNTNSFSKVASEKSEIPTPNNDGYLGIFTKQEFPSPTLAKPVFEAKEANTLLKPILFNEKYYVILVRAISLPNSMEDIKRDIVIADYKEKNKVALSDKIKAEKENTLLALASSTVNLSTLNGKEMVEYYKSSSPFEFNKGSVIDVNTKSIPGSEDISFYTSVFTTPVGSTSKVIALPDGIAIIKVLSEIKPTEEDYQNYISTVGIKRVKANAIQSTEKALRDTWAELEYAKSRISRNKEFFK